MKYTRLNVQFPYSILCNHLDRHKRVTFVANIFLLYTYAFCSCGDFHGVGDKQVFLEICHRRQEKHAPIAHLSTNVKLDHMLLNL